MNKWMQERQTFRWSNRPCTNKKKIPARRQQGQGHKRLIPLSEDFAWTSQTSWVVPSGGYTGWLLLGWPDCRRGFSQEHFLPLKTINNKLKSHIVHDGLNLILYLQWMELTVCEFAQLLLQCDGGVVSTEHFSRKAIHQLLKMLVQNRRLPWRKVILQLRMLVLKG